MSLYLVRLQNIIKHSWERNFVLFDKILVSTIKRLQWRFQAFFDVSLFERLFWKSCRPQKKTLIQGASPGIWYRLWYEDAIGRRSWYITTQERKICNMEIEIVMFVINGSMKLTDLPIDRSKSREKGRDLTQSYDKSPYTNRNVKRAKWQQKQRHKKVRLNRYEAEVLLYVVCLISSSTGYIWPRLFSNSGLFMDKTSSMYLCVKLNRDAKCFQPVESKDYINSASYE